MAGEPVRPPPFRRRNYRFRHPTNEVRGDPGALTAAAAASLAGSRCPFGWWRLRVASNGENWLLLPCNHDPSARIAYAFLCCFPAAENYS